MSATLVIIHIIGSVALMLWGLRMVRTGMERAAGSRMEHFMRWWTGNRLSACCSGLLLAMVMQGSTAATILTNGFVVRKSVTLGAGLALALGADLGSALAAFVLSLDLSILYPFLIGIGFLAHAVASSSTLRQVSRAVIGIGIVVLALQLLRSQTMSFTDSEGLTVVLVGLQGEPLIAVIVLALLTWLMHSSLTAVLFVSSLTVAGVIDSHLAILVILEANLGAGLPAYSATAGQSAVTRRLPSGNILFRTIGVLLVLPFVSQIVARFESTGLDATETVIVAHVLFNFAFCVVFLPFVSGVSKWFTRLLAEPTSSEDDQLGAYLLDEKLFNDADASLSSAARESIRLGGVVQGMFADVIDAIKNNDRKLAKQIAERDDQVDRMHRDIKLFITSISTSQLSESQSRRATQILTFVTDLEHIGDIIESIAGYARRKAIKGLKFSDEGMTDLEKMHQQVEKSMHSAFDVFMTGNQQLADQLIREKRTVGRLEKTLARAHLRRLQEGLAQSIETSSFHQDMLRDFKRIHSHLVAVAYTTIVTVDAEEFDEA